MNYICSIWGCGPGIRRSRGRSRLAQPTRRLGMVAGDGRPPFEPFGVVAGRISTTLAVWLAGFSLWVLGAGSE